MYYLLSKHRDPITIKESLPWKGLGKVKENTVKLDKFCITTFQETLLKHLKCYQYSHM